MVLQICITLQMFKTLQSKMLILQYYSHNKIKQDVDKTVYRILIDI